MPNFDHFIAHADRRRSFTVQIAASRNASRLVVIVRYSHCLMERRPAAPYLAV